MPQISVAELEAENARLRRELAEAWERQGASDEVLRVIAEPTGRAANCIPGAARKCDPNL